MALTKVSGNVIQDGIVISGIVTATEFEGNLTGTASTATASATAYGLSGAPDIVVGIISATGFVGDVTGNVTGDINAGIITATSITGVTTAGITTAYIGSLNDGPISGARNIIINGAMQISQRGTSFNFAHDGTTAAYTLDRWSYVAANLESYDGVVSQSSEAPDGFSNSLLITTGTAESSIDADDLVYLQTGFEGQNLQQLSYGDATAKTFTLSFWVRSSQTGTFALTFYQDDANRSRTTTYTIDAADTWEKKTVTITGDTSGVINNDNGRGLLVAWNLAAGSNWDTTDSTAWGAHSNSRWAYGHVQDGVITTGGATWYITGVQLEVGTVATPFERRSYGQELALCQRYYQIGACWMIGFGSSNGYIGTTVNFATEMRIGNPNVVLGGSPTESVNFSSIGTPAVYFNGFRLWGTITTGTNINAYYTNVFTATAEL